MGKRSYMEDAIHAGKTWVMENKVPFVSTLIIGLLTHMYMFTNKLVNHDEIWSLFEKGATIGSGRWGLEVLELVFPNYSMPWLYGVMSLTLIAIAVCLMVNLFHINGKVHQVILAGLVVSFPSLTGYFCYMFTSTAYAMAVLLAVMAVSVYTTAKKGSFISALLLAVFSLSIYQANINLISGMLVLFLLCKLLWEDSSIHNTFMRGMHMILYLICVLIVYYIATQLVLHFMGERLNSYAENNFQLKSVNLLYRLYVICVNILYLFTRGNWALINSPSSLIAHIVLIAILVFAVLRNVKKPAELFMVLFLAVMLVLAINAMYLIAEEDASHTLVLYSYVIIYFLAIKIADEYLTKKPIFKDAVIVSLLIILLSNIYCANITYLQLNTVYENGYAFFSSVVTQVKQTPGFTADKKIAIIGNGENWVYDLEEFGESKVRGVDQNLINVISRDEFVKYYIGFDAPFATEEEIAWIESTLEYQEMTEYPWYGSVQVIDDFVVVKLGTKGE